MKVIHISVELAGTANLTDVQGRQSFQAFRMIMDITIYYNNGIVSTFL